MAANERNIVVEDLSGNFPAHRNGVSKFALLMHNVLSPVECRELIDRSEAKGYAQALVNTGGNSQKLMTDFRNSGRCILFDPLFADVIFQRILVALKGSQYEDVLAHAPWIPMWKAQSYAVGCNERLSLLRYDPGHYFKPHFDGMYQRTDGPRSGERSFVTVQLYLNEGFRGGATTFLNQKNEERLVEVVPRTGSLLLFEHSLLHEGSELIVGRKYALRTDIMYTTKDPGHEYSRNAAGLSFTEPHDNSVPSRPSRPRRNSHDDMKKSDNGPEEEDIRSAHAQRRLDFS